MTEAAQQQDSKKSLDMVQLRQLLGALVERKESSTLLEVVFGVLLKAEKVIEDQAFEIQQLRKQLFGRRSEKLSPDQLSLFAQMLATPHVPRPPPADLATGRYLRSLLTALVRDLRRWALAESGLTVAVA